tara:strand:+ start:5441 stop:6325 length:885 start_codon:yes stop_codon:yes gene_type:complete
MIHEKNIFLLWLQGWDKAPWLQKKVLESWIFNNPDWKIKLIDEKNIPNYVNDIDYIFDKNKKITPQAKSDIIRLSLLKKYGGVWADSTLLCMQPLSHWVFDALDKSGIWMYHGHGSNLKSDLGPASWFIVSEKNGFIISEWKNACDYFWYKNSKVQDYFWMDGLFKNLLENKKNFKNQWLKTPFLYCEEIGSSHTLANYNFRMDNDTKLVKEILKIKPPYVLKLSSNFENIFPKLNSNKFKNSNVFFAISLSKRKYIYKHEFTLPRSISSPIKKNYFLRYFIKIMKRIISIFLR